MLQASVIVPTHNPHRDRLVQTLAALAAQTLSKDHWELIVVDNASTPALELTRELPRVTRHSAVVREERLGLTSARLAGIAAARGTIVLFVDDDNVLAADYLAHVVRLFAEHPKLGAAGGKIVPSFEVPPPPWTREFFPLLAVRDYGSKPIVSALPPEPGRYPEFAPVGAGMALRYSAALAYRDALAQDRDRIALDRRGLSLSSGGDNDIVLTLLKNGWQAGYFPELVLTHLIPAGRLEASYLARLQHDLARTWVQVLSVHGIRPWPAIAPCTVPWRKARAWFRHRAWRGGANFIRWRGACGSFEARRLLAK